MSDRGVGHGNPKTALLRFAQRVVTSVTDSNFGNVKYCLVSGFVCYRGRPSGFPLGTLGGLLLKYTCKRQIAAQ